MIRRAVIRSAMAATREAPTRPKASRCSLPSAFDRTLAMSLSLGPLPSAVYRTVTSRTRPFQTGPRTICGPSAAPAGCLAPARAALPRFPLLSIRCYHKRASFRTHAYHAGRTHLKPAKEVFVANTTKIEDTAERKKVKRAARKKAAPKAKRTTPRGSNKKKIKKLARGQSKR